MWQTDSKMASIPHMCTANHHELHFKCLKILLVNYISVKLKNKIKIKTAFKDPCLQISMPWCVPTPQLWARLVTRF